MTVTAHYPCSVDPDRPPRHTDPVVWRLRCALLSARERLPYASAEARLLDGLERYVKFAARPGLAPLDGGAALRSTGPAWAAVLTAVAAAAELCGPEARGLLAPWTVLVPTPARAPGVAPAGTSPSRGGGFEPLEGAAS